MFLKYRCLTTQLARTERPVEPEMLSFGVLARQLQRTPKQNQIRGTEGSWTLALVPPYNSINHRTTVTYSGRSRALEIGHRAVSYTHLTLPTNREV